MYAQQGNGDSPDAEFIVCSLDLISGMAEGLKESIAALIAESNLLPLLLECLKNPEPAVRESGFALVGDLAKTRIGLLQPVMPQLFPYILANLDPEHASVCNNCSWSLGEIAIKVFVH